MQYFKSNVRSTKFSLHPYKQLFSSSRLGEAAYMFYYTHKIYFVKYNFIKYHFFMFYFSTFHLLIFYLSAKISKRY
ncbi:hypothetical protein SELSPUOL_02482 [Selenomonas sputigena ATCC 35185]|uniref:Uncharacterized protein n=1 Tax=Selenomonas sputigena (strain ATCC 35185 / DSM 20758 / CCUG 44933 / VPI D19B-28) TaxID=546271 RepID=C9LYC3_SELS3|nr:hypothetical protein SELSPUOL_02482 [Selenomonas sputigena ATCC 35185]